MLANPHSILITDDDPLFRESVREVLAPQGFRTLLAENGQETLQIVHREPIDLLLLDMHMPRLTGLQTIRLVKNVRRSLPCILMSADADDVLIEQALRAQAFAVLPKPVSSERITQAVREALASVHKTGA